MTIKITDHLFQYGSDKFFRGSAYKMELGTFGEKKDPIGPKAYLAVEGKIRASHLAERPIHQGKPMEIDWSSVQKAALEANGTLKFFGIGVNGGTSFDYEYAKKAKLKLINYWINEGPFVDPVIDQLELGLLGIFVIERCAAIDANSEEFQRAVSFESRLLDRGPIDFHRLALVYRAFCQMRCSDFSFDRQIGLGTDRVFLFAESPQFHLICATAKEFVRSVLEQVISDLDGHNNSPDLKMRPRFFGRAAIQDQIFL